jgi:hypothetical protein
MSRFPKITVQKWTADGPAYTIHRDLAGRRNRRARLAGESAEELVGPHDLDEVEAADGSMVFAIGNDELWAFAHGSVYELEVFVDGDPAVIHVDARQGHALEAFTNGVELVSRKALDDDELAELLDDIDSTQVIAEAKAEEDAAQPVSEFEPSDDDEDAVAGDSGKWSDEEE